MLLTRQIWLLAGLGSLSVAWSHVHTLVAGAAFTGHMVGHMLLVAAAAPALAAAVADSQVDPAVRWPRLFSAVPASFGELIVVWAWHAPALHLLARHHRGMFAAEQLSFLAAGLWLWIALVGGRRDTRSDRSATAVLALLLTFGHMTLLGALLSLAPRLLYVHGPDADVVSGLADQQRGGSIMLIVSALVYVPAALWFSHRLLHLTPSRRGAR